MGINSIEDMCRNFTTTVMVRLEASRTVTTIDTGKDFLTAGLLF